MKKFFILTVLWVLINCMVAMCGGADTLTSGNTVREEGYLSSGTKTADALILTGKGILRDLVIATDGTNATAYLIYDGLSATGTVILAGTCLAATNTCVITGLHRKASIGIYVDITVGGGGSTAYSVGYLK